MSATEDALIAACTAAETAVVQLAQAYTAYVNGYKAAASGIDIGAGDGLARRGEFEAAIGPHILAAALRGRLVALDARAVAEQGGAMMPQDAGWVAYLTDKITAVVP